MIETLLYLALSFGSGYLLGNEHSTITTECRSDPLIITNCIEIYPPSNDTFGATTESYASLIDTYKNCRAACITQK